MDSSPDITELLVAAKLGDAKAEEQLFSVLYADLRWTNYTFAGWQNLGEDLLSVVQNPAYPADDYSLPKGSPGVGFVVFDPNQAGRTNPLIMPPPVLATFPTKLFNPATDF